jgi:hypothetical protein
MKAAEIYAARKTYITPVNGMIGGRPISMEYIEVTRKANRPPIRKPYEYVATQAAVDNYVQQLRDMKQFEKDGKLQMFFVQRKGLTRGIRLEFSMLGFNKGLVGDTRGLHSNEWDILVETVQQLLHSFLGKDALLYAEPWNDTSKFQARFETYILFEGR